ncbi:MAG: rhodanese-like domain-containing protein [Verrucomicrobiota bacterium]
MSRGLLLEAAALAAAGAAFALVANALSPSGLSLTRNYFPPAATNSTVPAATTAEDLVRQAGFQPLDRIETVALFRQLPTPAVVFIDARDAEHFRAGHIPGSYPLDPYHPESDLVEVLPACQLAEHVVVYCQGGECEDSRFAAILLRDAGIDARKIAVYLGGITDWRAAAMPVDTAVSAPAP